MADRFIFKGSKALEMYVRNFSKEYKLSLEESCKQLSMKSVQYAKDNLNMPPPGKSMPVNTTGTLSQSLIPIPGPYIKGTKAEIGFTQNPGSAATKYGVVTEFGRKTAWRPNFRNLVEYAREKWGGGRKAFGYAVGLFESISGDTPNFLKGKRTKKRAFAGASKRANKKAGGISGAMFGKRALERVFGNDAPKNIFKNVIDANGKAVKDARKWETRG